VIDAQANLDFIPRCQALRCLEICVTNDIMDGNFDTLPPIPHLKTLQIQFGDTSPWCDQPSVFHTHPLIDLSVLDSLQVLVLSGTEGFMIRADTIGGSSRSVRSLIFRGVHLAGNGWHSFYVRLASSLRSLALIDVESHRIGRTELPVLKSLELDGWDLTGHYIPDFVCPKLTTLVCTYHCQAVTSNNILQEVVH
jgi:hypothetical protein